MLRILGGRAWLGTDFAFLVELAVTGSQTMGAVAGGVLGYASGDDPPGMMSMTAGGKSAFGAILFGSLGALFGALGAQGEQWETVPDDRWQFMIGSNGRGRHGLVVAWRF